MLVIKKNQRVKKVAKKTLVLSKIWYLSQKCCHVYLFKNEACVKIFQDVHSWAKKLKSQTSYIKVLEEKVNNLTTFIKKEKKPAELGIKNIEIIVSRLRALTATHPGRKSTI